MKKLLSHFFVAAALIAVVSLTACGTTSGAKVAPLPRHTIIDYQGAVLGSPIPAWVEEAMNDDLHAIGRMSQLSGKVPIVEYGSGQNLELLRSWVNNFNVAAGVARRISTYVDAEFGGAQLGSKDSPENRNFMQETVATISQTQFSGLAREMSYWVKVKLHDQREEFRYYVVYSIPEDILQHQIDVAMGKVAAATKEQQELKNEVEDAIQRARWNKVQQIEN